MKRNIVLLLSIVCLASCNNNDDTMEAKGEIRCDRQVYQLNTNIVHYSKFQEYFPNHDYLQDSCYMHVLSFFGVIRIRVIIRSENSLIPSGEFHVGMVTFNNQNSIPSEINLADDHVHFAQNYNPSKNIMNFSYTYTEKGDISEIELKCVDNENDFFLKWKGTLTYKLY